MKNIKNKIAHTAAIAVMLAVSLLPMKAEAFSISDFDAFPPFLPKIVSPNILFLLDISENMIRPAYGVCYEELSSCRDNFLNFVDDYDSSTPYYGYFDNGFSDLNDQPGTYDDANAKTYACDGASCAKDPAGAWNGNWLNWLTMTQFDIMSKVMVGGNMSNPSDSNALNVNSGEILESKLASIDGTIRKMVTKDKSAGRTGFTNFIDPQDIPFGWYSTPGTYDLLVSGNNSGWIGEIDFPFDFSMYGTDFAAGSKLTVNINGWAAFVTGASSKAINYKMPTTSTTELYDYAIAPYWINQESVNPGGGAKDTEIQFFVEGTEPNRVAVLTFYNVVDEKYDEGKTNNLTYQVLFYEQGSHIIFQYLNVQEGATTSASHPTDPNTFWGQGALATVGVQGDASAGEVKLYSHHGMANDGVTPTTLWDGQALLMTPQTMYYEVVPNAQQTVFQPGGHFASGNDHKVKIDVEVIDLAEGSACDDAAGYYGNTTDDNDDKCTDHLLEGLLHELQQKALGGSLGFRLAVMYSGLTQSGTTAYDGADLELSFNEEVPNSLMVDLRHLAPLENAPLSEALYEATKYYKQAAPEWSGDYVVDPNACGDVSGNQFNTDPYCYQSAKVKAECCKSFILLVSSGNYSHDFKTNIYGDALIADTEDGEPPTISIRAIDGSDEGIVDNEGWLDNVAYESHLVDLRTDLEATQNLDLFVVNTYGDGVGKGTEVLKKAAKYGGFEDSLNLDSYDASGAYDCDQPKDGTKETGEDDKNCDGLPDTYFQPSGNDSVKDKITAAVSAMLKSSASGTSVSVLSTSAGGQGAVYQAYFYPAKIEGENEDRSYPGFMRSFFIDKYQNLRDDASGGSYNSDGDYSGGPADARLSIYSGDYVANMHLNDDYQVSVELYDTPDGGEILPETPTHDILLDKVMSVWEAGELLANVAPADRDIYAWVDSSNDGVVDGGDMQAIEEGGSGGEVILFDGSNVADLAPYLRANDPDDPAFSNFTVDGPLTALHEAEDIIDFIRGEYVTGYRNRCITSNQSGATKETNSDDRRSDCELEKQRVWPLGDIIYSTPTLVTGPSEKYDEIYGETSYVDFKQLYAKRRNAIYVGANDGMLHAFNAGFFEPKDTKFCNGYDTGGDGYISGDNINSAGECGTIPTDANHADYTLGEEMWAFIPNDNLPHLAWLACNGTNGDPTACGNAEYTHVYFMDQRPKVSDVQIFSDDDTHPNGWGTILIAGMRYGGGAMDLTFDNDSTVHEFRSAYYMFDITNPEEKPKLLGRYTHPDLGFTTSYPAIARVENEAKTEASWFAVFGSGPRNDAGVKDYRDYNANLTPQAGKIFVVEMEATGFTNDNVFDTGDLKSIMGDPSVIDVNLDFSADVIYIGSTVHVDDDSTKGAIYRLNTLREPDLSVWTANNNLSTLFVDDPDTMGPLLIPPSASMDTQGNFWVYFGTGILRNKNDMVNKEQQRFYAIKDACWENKSDATKCRHADKTQLSDPYNYVREPDLFNANDAVIRPTTGSGTQVEAAECPDGTSCSYNELISYVREKDGWYVDLYVDGAALKPSERVLARSAVLGGLLLFTTYTPLNDVCSVFGSSSLYALYYETGTAYNKPVFEGEDDQGNDINAEEIQKKLDLGAGMPTAVGVAVGDTVTGFVQKSTGEIVRVKAAPGLGVKSGMSSWREKTRSGGTVEIEETYKHIVK